MKALALLFCMCSSDTYSQLQKWIDSSRKILLTDTQSVYMVGRGTATKAGAMVQSFNCNHNMLTHIGILYFEHGEEKIVHVTDHYETGSTAIRKENLCKFLEVDEVNYLGIWKIPLTAGQRKNLITTAEDYTKRNIVFDMGFNIRHDDSLYCSEFCARMLAIAGFNLLPETRPLQTPLFKRILDRELITYYPVDFFLTHIPYSIIEFYREKIW